MPITSDWQPVDPIHAIIFDCDGTLSTIEGIDELAIQNNVGDIVQAITAKAMSDTGINPELYRERLNHVKPSLLQAEQLGSQYFMTRTQDSLEVIKLLQGLGKTIYIASAGINPSVKLFADQLGISATQVFAVDVSFDADGNYQDFDTSSPLASRNGKREIARQLIEKHGSIALIGDGMNDVVAIDIVTRFIGYGGTVFREKIARLCEYYIQEKSLAAALPLLLTPQEYTQLASEERNLFERGLSALQEGTGN